MFARSSKKTKLSSSHIADDVANLINEIDNVAAPFDESVIVTKDPSDEDALLVDDAQEISANAAIEVIPGKEEEEEEGFHSSELSMQVSELSTSLADELAFLEETLKDDVLTSHITKANKETQQDEVPATTVVAAAAEEKPFSTDMVHDIQPNDEPTTAPTVTHEENKEVTSSQENTSDNALEQQQTTDSPAPKKTFVSKMWSSISSKVKKAPGDDSSNEEVAIGSPVDNNVADTTLTQVDDAALTLEENKVASKEATKDLSEEEFNPFINIGNRLLDDNDDKGESPQDDPSIDSIDSKMESIKKMLAMTGKVLLFILKGLMQLLFVCIYNFKITSVVLLVGAITMYLKNFFSVSISISVHSDISAWNSSMTEDLTPPLVEEVAFSDASSSTNGPFESTIRDLIAVFKVLAYSIMIALPGFSIIGIKTTANERDTLCNYTKQEDDRSRYDNLTLSDLKKALRARNLCTTGLHSHLVDRLVAQDNNGVDTSCQVVDIDVSIVKRNTTVKVIQEKLRERGLPVTGLKDDLVAKVWIPARLEELKLYTMKELREVLVDKKLSNHGKSKDDLIRRLIEAGH